MNIESIAPVALNAATALMTPGLQASEGAVGGAGFAQWISSEFAATNTALAQAESGIRKVALGDSSNLHGVMIDLEQAKLSFQLLTQVRTHALDAYQEILRMQV